MKKIQYLLLLLACCGWQAAAWAYKPYNELEVSQADLSHYPKNHYIPEPGVEVTLGDLHGNSLKLLYFLIRNDVVTIPEKDYPSIVTIYNKEPEDLRAKDLALFRTILNGAVINSAHALRFLGDDLCDRGMNDYFTLYIYQKLDEARVPFEIVLSNHGNFFLTAYESPQQSFDYNPYGQGKNESTVQSMLNLGKLIANGMVDKQELVNTIEKHYLKHLILPGFTLNKSKNEITIYSHAPLDINMLAALANDLNRPFNDSTLDDLAKGLSNINGQIQQWILTKSFTAHYNRLKEEHKKTGTASPLTEVLWNRDYNRLNRDSHPENRSYSVNYVHGHDSQPNVFNLDNLLGKGKNQQRGSYAIHLTHS